MITWIHATANPRVAGRTESSSNTHNSQSSSTGSRTFLTVDTFTAEGVGGTTTQQYSTFYHHTYSEESAYSHVRETDSQGNVTGSTSYSQSSSASRSIIYSLSGRTTNTAEGQTGSAFWTYAQTSVTTQSGSTSASISNDLSAGTTYQSYGESFSFLMTNTYSSTYQGSDPWGTYSDSTRETVTFESTYSFSTEFSSTATRGTFSYTLAESFLSTVDSWRVTTTRTTVDVFFWSAGSSQEVYEGSTVYYRSTALSGTSTITVTYNTAFQASTTANSTTVTLVDTVGTTTSTRSVGGGSYRAQISFVTAGIAGYNEWLGLLKETTGLFLPATQALRMVDDASFTYSFEPQYVSVGTSLLPTSVHSTNSSLTVINRKTRTQVSESSGETFLTSSYSSTTKTAAGAIPATLIPYTGTVNSPEAVFGTTSTSYSSPSVTLGWVSSATSSSLVPRMTTVQTFTADGTKTFSWLKTAAYGYSTRMTTIYLNESDPRLVLPETTVTASTSSTINSTFSGGAEVGTSFSSLTQMSAFGRTLETQNAGGQGDLGIAGPVESWVRSYRYGAAWIAPAPDLDAQNAGSNLAGLPIAFRIPVSYSSRADGAHVYLQTDGSLERTYLANSSGGVSASVASSAYTTVIWRISRNSVSATTMSRQNSSSIVSASTAVAVSPAGDAGNAAYLAYDGGPVTGAIGGRQVLAPQTVMLKAGLYIVYEFPDGASMNSRTESSSEPVSQIIGTSVNLSYREQLRQWMVVGRAQPQIATFARNHIV